jgi:hypothetical protein
MVIVFMAQRILLMESPSGVLKHGNGTYIGTRGKIIELMRIFQPRLMTPEGNIH